jgi:hypothetical protein
MSKSSEPVGIAIGIGILLYGFFVWVRHEWLIDYFSWVLRTTLPSHAEWTTGRAVWGSVGAGRGLRHRSTVQRWPPSIGGHGM